MVHDTDQLPSLRSDRRPSIGIAAELVAFCVLSTVVLDRDTVVRIRHVEPRDESVRLIAQDPVEFGLRQSRFEKHEADEGFSRRLGTGADEGKCGRQLRRPASTQSRRSGGEILSIREPVPQNGVAESHEMFAPKRAREVRPGLGRAGDGEPLAHRELIERNTALVAGDAARPWLTSGGEGRDIEGHRMPVGERKTPQHSCRGMAEVLSGTEAGCVCLAPFDDREGVRFGGVRGANPVERRLKIEGLQAVSRYAHPLRFSNGERVTEVGGELPSLHPFTPSNVGGSRYKEPDIGG